MATCKVMVVEDDADVRSGLTEILAMEGFEVVAARDGEEAWQILNAGKDLFDVILLDYTMPRMDAAGFRSLQRGSERFNTIPVILFSAAALSDSTIAALEVSHVLRKPVDLDVILDTVKRFA